MSEFLTETLGVVHSILQFKIFELNNTPVTLYSVVMFLFVVLMFWVLSRIIDRGLLRRVLPRFQIEPGIQYTLVRISHYIIVAIGALFAFQFVGIDLSGLAVIFGLLSVGIGFGLQNVTSNFISGIILLFERPITVGDRVTVGGTEGDVTAINMRSSTVRTLNNISIIVPNSEFISSQVVNWSYGDPKVRVDSDVGVSYNSDLDTVQKALMEAATEHPEVLETPGPEVLLMSFGDSSWDMRLRYWVGHPRRYYTIRSDINCNIIRKFRHYGVEIPFPQRDLHVRSPLPVPFRNENTSEN